VVSEGNLTFINGLPQPAFYLDETGVVVHGNGALDEWACVRQGMNLWSWMLGDPQARHRLIRWREDWAGPMAKQLRTQALLSTGPAKVALEGTLAQVRRASPDVEELWVKDPTLYERPQGVVRHLYLPGGGPTTFSVWSGRPDGASHLRLIAFNVVGSSPGYLRPAS
jgi:MmyB-like transcription regulator ligand binding domain